MGKEITLLATMQRLGHRSITSTQLYTQLIKGHQRDEYTFKAAITLEEAQTLIESGFESTESYGVLAVSRFVGSDVSTDVFMRVSTFLKNVSSIA